MARDSYSYKKYQKELARKKKVEEKKQRRLEKKATEGEMHIVSSDDKRALLQGEPGQVSNDQVDLE